MSRYFKKSKYNNKKIVADGIEFDSKKEAKRWQELRNLERAGVISDLERQVRFELIPSQKIKVDGKTETAERPVSYVADFVYFENGEKIVEDTKGVRTKDYIIKRKLMLFVHNLKVREI